MIKFQNNGFTIQIKTNYNSVEAWIELQKALIDYLGNVEDGDINSRYWISVLLKEMTPDFCQIIIDNDS